MRPAVLMFMVVFSSGAWGQDIFDRFGDALSKISLHDSMNPWERELSKQGWQTILENCYDRTENSNAKDALSSLLSRHDQISTNVSARQKDQEILLFCAHALSLANKVGINLSAIPLNPDDHKTLFRAKTVEDCYAVSEEGFSQGLRKNIRMVAQIQTGASGGQASDQITLPDLMWAYSSFCGAVFSEDKHIPVEVIFSER